MCSKSNNNWKEFKTVSRIISNNKLYKSNKIIIYNDDKEKGCFRNYRKIYHIDNCVEIVSIIYLKGKIYYSIKFIILCNLRVKIINIRYIIG